MADLPNAPVTRREQFLNAVATGNVDDLPNPITREEMYLNFIAENASSKEGVTPAQVRSIIAEQTDDILSNASENAVQNKVIHSALSNKADRSDIPTSLPANGGNADTVGKKTVSNFLGNGTGYSYPYDNGVDLNVIKEEYHKFVINASNSPTNKQPHGFLDVAYFDGAGFITAETGNEKPIVCQIYRGFRNHDSIYVRYYYEEQDEGTDEANGWTEWKRVFDTNNCPIQRVPEHYLTDQTGTHFVKFANGFCVQWGFDYNISGEGTTATISFPYAFTDVPVVVANKGFVTSVDKGSFNVQVESTSSGSLRYIAVGYIE